MKLSQATKQIALLLFFLSSKSFANYPPKSPCDQFVQHTHYNVCYSNQHRQAFWVSHWLTSSLIQGKQKRTNNYRMDPQIYDAVLGSDYKSTGFDRGHLVPAGDMKLNRQSMSESFYMSNMSPQVPSMNRGSWRALEEKVRKMTLNKGGSYIITAPILEDQLPQIFSGVSIPNYYYKILYQPDSQFMVAFLMPNLKMSKYKLKDFVVSVDELEALTGFDFFSQLEDSVEKALEAQRNYNWN